MVEKIIQIASKGEIIRELSIDTAKLWIDGVPIAKQPFVFVTFEDKDGFVNQKWAKTTPEVANQL